MPALGPTWRLVVLLVTLLQVTCQQQQTQSSDNFGSNLVSGPTPPSLSTIKKLMKILQQCSTDDQRGMQKVHLSSPNITCNDGSPAGFYLRKSHGSKRWIIFLEGGWYCFDQKSCHARWLRLRHLMTSRQWPDTRTAGGILSLNPEENPFWWNANHVLVPYCTSDSWSGTRREPGGDARFSFMGAMVVQQVVKDLLPFGLNNASMLLLAGSSAGGTGVMVNLDVVADLLHSELRLPHIAVRGVTDSGWFLDRAPYSQNAHTLTPMDAIRKGQLLWHGQVPSLCRAQYPSEPWRCYFGYRAYPTLTVPLFVFQWLFDEAQMRADNVGAPVTKQQWDYIHQMGDILRNSFTNVTAVFAPSCISHSVLTNKDWLSVKIDDVSLPQALRCWEMSHYDHHAHLLHHINDTEGLAMLGDSPLSVKLAAKNLIRSGIGVHPIVASSSPPPEERRRRRRKKHNNTAAMGALSNGNSPGNHGKGKKKRKKKGRHGGGGGRKRVERGVTTKCPHHLIERCSWPQCNHSCPKLHNPVTGQEMDFIELLKSFGLDMTSLANALGVDIHTLNNMDHDELLNLLTQQTNK